jgi:8-oxo-dGTP diphosphatase
MSALRKARPSARLLIVDPDNHVLLFRFDASDGRPFWATPGGGCAPGETYEQAARRELIEETGFDLDLGRQVHQRHVEFTTLEGEEIWSDERYFLVRVGGQTIDTSRHTALERSVMQHHRWWPLAELRITTDLVFPENIADLVKTTLQGE